ncbi:serine/threonine-protein kinase [Croceicoccus naphthovorans]|uniref:serine/threonine-protein kinase n=1 Tax=Croceicoccus naphthovorans TaxID=1348774 RepID=UPI00069EC6B0|nr:serine/threonine-protein kinase [Croceicoccus naphthovorans]MBB3991958.1 serine/threonine protein kinase [Croceicoccus naphthovorans]
MSKAYSTKALPSGTILREWRLEEVLGVGGFGIVYKGRGIYFDELVAIKEYFPSSISERDEDDTVVPVDSNAEEVHALGLKKFVEEAKLLWNLSTPTRHPNIVSVRSLFEIHGTAYMVMDFEDGTPLSRLLKSGTKFNQAALSKIILPIAEGLDRAHRVGVLHRDIKPPNIMVGDDDRAVLIDFGSARFESGEATSTKVTFHTPPYAPIEQYVRTYEQGPWTDIYALGVVLYECVSGEKPPEVLERLHGGAGKPLVEGNWPGFSRTFLKAIDAAMTIRPQDRPQSIAQWLDMFEADDIRTESTPFEPDEDDEDATRIAVFDTGSDTIKPVAPIAKGFGGGALSTGVPDKPDEAKFVGRPKPNEAEKVPVQPAVAAEKAETPKDEPAAKSDDVAPASAETPTAKKADTPPPADKALAKEPTKKAKEADNKAKDDKKEGIAKPAIAVVIVGAILAFAGWQIFGGKSGDGPVPSAPTPMISAPADASEFPAMFTALAEEAANAGMGDDLTEMLTADAETVDSEQAAVARLREFASAARSAGEARTRTVARDLPWADVSRSNSARGESPQRRKAADDLKAGFAGLRDKADAVEQAQGLEATLVAVREEIAAYSTLRTLAAATYRAKGTDSATQAAEATPDSSTPTATETATIAASTPAATSDAGVSAATRREFDRNVDSARDIARQIDRLASSRKPGSNASDEEKEGYRIRQASADAAKQYTSYLDTLEASMRGTSTEAEARNSVVKASQTKSYLQALLNRARAAQ